MLDSIIWVPVYCISRVSNLSFLDFLRQISVLYFQEDVAQTSLHDDGPRGNYLWLNGDLLDFDPVARTIDLGDRKIEMDRIYAIE